LRQLAHQLQYQTSTSETPEGGPMMDRKRASSKDYAE
jgi:hypothetical protein